MQTIYKDRHYLHSIQSIHQISSIDLQNLNNDMVNVEKGRIYLLDQVLFRK